jgi:putative FmdB family regulatory protein
MPIYEYHCEKCGKDFECLVFGSEKPECKGCHSKKFASACPPAASSAKGSGGQTVKAAAGSSCGGCHAGSCAGCKH